MRSPLVRHDGEVARLQDGRCFRPDQCEWHKLIGPHAGIDAQFGIVRLQGGEWLDDIHEWRDSRRHLTRAGALRRAVARGIRRIRRLARIPVQSALSPHRVHREHAEAQIAWLLGEAGRPARRLYAALARPPARTEPQQLDLMRRRLPNDR